MKNISAQEFRNAYEHFYNYMRNYLWPYATLKELADMEVEIYTQFMNMNKLKVAFEKLKSSIKDVVKEDENLAEFAEDLDRLINARDPQIYSRLKKVTEVNPDKPKLLKEHI